MFSKQLVVGIESYHWWSIRSQVLA